VTPTPQRRSLLLAAVGFAVVESRSAPLSVLHSWLSTWTEICHVIAGMHRQGYDVQLTQYDEGGVRRSMSPGWSTQRRALPRPRGSRPRGAPCSVRPSALCERHRPERALHFLFHISVSSVAHPIDRFVHPALGHVGARYTKAERHAPPLLSAHAPPTRFVYGLRRLRPTEMTSIWRPQPSQFESSLT